VSPTWATFLFESANFVLLAAMLGWFFFKPVRAALEERRAALEAEGEEAARRHEEAEQALAEAASQRQEAEEALAGLRARVREEAERERDRLLEAAREQAQRERDTLKSELAALRRGQAKRITSDAAAAAGEIVIRLLERIEGPDLERALARTATSELERLASEGAVAPVIIESAGEIEADLVEALAGAAGVEPSAIEVRIVPDLGAGLRVLTARGLVDASVAGLGAYAERALAARAEADEVSRG
jgi:F-type H+-transporting ATPase subunit b